MFNVLLMLFVVALIGGGLGYHRVGFVGWSPAAIVLTVLAALCFTGTVHYGV